MNEIDTWELAMWVWLASMIVVFVGWHVGTAVQKWLDRNKPRRVQRDWATEQKCRVTRRAFKTRAGIR